jgi:hypothetical protein
MSFSAILICIYSTYHFVRLTKINCDDDELLQKHRNAALLLEEKNITTPCQTSTEKNSTLLQ